MYQPALLPDQIKALYYLKVRLGRPMTELVREAVDRYLENYGGSDRLISIHEEADSSRKSRIREVGLQ